MNQKNEMINLLKCAGCICVVFIHIPFPGVFGALTVKLSTFAVPVFFMISGYYSNKCDYKTIGRRLKKSLLIFIYGYICFIACKVWFLIKDNMLFEWFRETYTVKSLMKFVVYLIVDSAAPLWYLVAIIEIYIFWFFICKKNKEEKLLNCLPYLFIIHIILCVYRDTNDLPWNWGMNFVTSGLVWFLLGYFFSSYRGNEVVKFISNTGCYLLIFIGLFISMLPHLIDFSINFSSCGTVFYVIGLFLYAIKNSSNQVPKIISYIGSKLSLHIYILHVPINIVTRCVISEMRLTGGYMYPILIVCETIIIAYLMNQLIIRLKRKVENIVL